MLPIIYTRKELIHYLKSYISSRAYEYHHPTLTVHDVMMIIEALEQSQRRGHWIEHEHNGIGHIECSECFAWFLESHLLRNSYCPNCGAKMVEPQESEEDNAGNDRV